MCWLSWFLDPGGWSKTAAVGLYFIFPGICTLSLLVLVRHPAQMLTLPVVLNVSKEIVIDYPGQKLIKDFPTQRATLSKHECPQSEEDGVLTDDIQESYLFYGKIVLMLSRPSYETDILLLTSHLVN
ncbi:hypothetical protein STEG23_020820, partial [Scotinomys teguina]